MVNANIMKIAICLYGQPRDYNDGFKIIDNFIKLQTNVTVDFFYHAWTLNEGDVYSVGPWRNINANDIAYKPDVIEELNKLYNPVAHSYENQIATFDEKLYINTIAYNNTLDQKSKNNINNVLSQMYSRNKVRNTFNDYIVKNNVHYDAVMMCRFDCNTHINIDLNNVDLSNVIVGYMHCPRAIFPDCCLIMPSNIFLDWFNMFENLHIILNNAELQIIINKYNERHLINSEELIFANYLFHNKTVDNVRYYYQMHGGAI
jgi:hypothetical protein